MLKDVLDLLKSTSEKTKTALIYLLLVSVIVSSLLLIYAWKFADKDAVAKSWGMYSEKSGNALSAKVDSLDLDFLHESITKLNARFDSLRIAQRTESSYTADKLETLFNLHPDRVQDRTIMRIMKKHNDSLYQLIDSLGLEVSTFYSDTGFHTSQRTSN